VTVRFSGKSQTTINVKFLLNCSIECKVKLALQASGRGHYFVHINVLVFNPGLMLRIELNKFVSIFMASPKCKFLHRKETHYMGTAVAQWLRCCVTNRKVAGSIPVGVIGIFH